jgi:5'-methylthioadenosine phosphorylase
MKNADNACKMVAAALAAMPRERTFQCGKVLTHATSTAKSLVPESTR